MLRFITSLSINRLNKADDGCFVGIDIGSTRFAQTLSKTLCLLPEALGKFPHRYEQLCSSLWAEKLIVMAKNAHR